MIEFIKDMWPWLLFGVVCFGILIVQRRGDKAKKSKVAIAGEVLRHGK